MKKNAFLTKEKIEEIVKEFPTPFHIYDEKGIKENAPSNVICPLLELNTLGESIPSLQN